MRRSEWHDGALWSDAAPRLLRLAGADARVRQERSVGLSHFRIRDANLPVRLHRRWRIRLRELDGTLELDGMEGGVAVDRQATHGIGGDDTARRILRARGDLRTNPPREAGDREQRDEN